MDPVQAAANARARAIEVMGEDEFRKAIEASTPSYRKMEVLHMAADAAHKEGTMTWGHLIPLILAAREHFDSLPEPLRKASLPDLIALCDQMDAQMPPKDGWPTARELFAGAAPPSE